MQLGIISNHPRKEDKSEIIEMGLVAFPATSFRPDGVNFGLVTITWTKYGKDYAMPVIGISPCGSKEELLEASTITTAISNLIKKNGWKKAIGHPAHLLTHLEKQVCRHVTVSEEGLVTKVAKRKAGDKRYGLDLGGEKFAVTAASEKAAQSAINRLAVEKAKGNKDKVAFAAAMADWIISGMAVQEINEKVNGVDVAPLTVYSTDAGKKKAADKK